MQENSEKKNICYTVKIQRNFCGSVERKSGESNSLTYFAMTYSGNWKHAAQGSTFYFTIQLSKCQLNKIKKVILT